MSLPSSFDAWLTTDPEGPCDVCGEFVDSCICPECPECGAQGDPHCYADVEDFYPVWRFVKEHFHHHGLVRGLAQRMRWAYNNWRWDEWNRGENEYFNRLAKEWNDED